MQKEKQKQQATDMLHGPLVGKMIWFALPLAFTSVFQQLFNAADVVVLGQLVSMNAMAAVGNNTPIVSLLVALLVGLALGANVVIAQRLGGGNAKHARRAVHSGIMLAAVIGVLLMLASELLADRLLTALLVPAEVLPDAETYLRIYLLGIPAMALYNFEAAVLRGYGDTKKPLLALIAASLLNIILNLAAVLLLDLGTAGVAAATTLSNFVAALVLWHFLRQDHGVVKVERKLLVFTAQELREIIRIGLPAGIQGALFSLSNLLIQTSINSLGADAMAASSAGFIIEALIYSFTNAIGQTVTTFVGQNFGARNIPRCCHITRVGMIIGACFAIASGTAAVLLDRQLLRLFTAEEAVIALGTVRILYVSGLVLPSGFLEVLSGALRGFGSSMPPAVISLVTICGSRVVWVYNVFDATHDFGLLMLVYPISWALTALLLAFVYEFYRRHLLQTYPRSLFPT